MKERKIKKTRWLWLMLFISWFVDTCHCNYLAQKYQCELAELLFKTPFYWLSVLFGVVDLLLGISIWQRATTKQYFQPMEWNVVSLEYELDFIPYKLSFSIDPWKFEKFASAYFSFISVCSLVVDMIKFIF